MGELSLDGHLRPIKGALPIAIQARRENFKGIILPKENAKEAAIVNDLDVYGIDHIKEAVDFMNKEIKLEPTIVDTREIFSSTINGITHIINHLFIANNRERTNIKIRA